MGRKQFTFYESFYSALRRIRKKADRADAYDAIVTYALLGQEPDLDSLPDAAAIAFELIRPTLDASRRKSESGRTGGQNARMASEPQDDAERESEREANPETKKQTPNKPQANRKQTPNKPEANGKQTASEKEKENEKEVEDECQTRAHARESDGDLCGSIDGADLTHEIEQNRHAQQLIRRYGLPDSEATLCALIDDFDRHGAQTVEKALEDAALSDNRGGMSIAYYRAVLKNAGEQQRASPPGEWQGTNGKLETYW